MCLAWQELHNILESLLLREANHAVELVALQSLELCRNVANALGVVASVAYHIWLTREYLPATCKARCSCGAGQALAEGAARDGEWRMLGKIVGSSARCDDVVALVVAQEVDIELVVAVVACALHTEVLVLVVEVLDAVQHPLLLGEDEA